MVAEAQHLSRPLGTMVAYGFPGLPLSVDLDLARRMGASLLEALPDWESRPDPAPFRHQVEGEGFRLHSAHGSWGRRSMTGVRVDLASLDESARLASVDDLRLCLDWLERAGGRVLVVHPGVLSRANDAEARRAALLRSLVELADHASPSGPVLCVENMPPGVHPGSWMADLAELVREIGRPELALILDTGHAHLGPGVATETIAAGPLLRSLHVHDNDGRSDAHLPPGLGGIDWADWGESLDRVEYRGPVLLECIRHIRHDPGVISVPFLTLLADLTRDPLVIAARDSTGPPPSPRSGR